jgi:hypothetical protein
MVLWGALAGAHRLILEVRARGLLAVRRGLSYAWNRAPKSLIG